MTSKFYFLLFLFLISERGEQKDFGEEERRRGGEVMPCIYVVMT
jgi:hypothetical protein